jgi:hypothetical protein
MSWEDFYRRRDAIALVLAHARHHKGTGLPFDDIEAVRSTFADREELALALQYKWSQLLMGRIAVALADAGRTEDVDHVEAIATAWRTTASSHPELRDLLDAYLPDGGEVFQTCLRAEQRMVALAAGLAEPGEPADAAARIGAAFLALIRTAPRHRRVERPRKRGIAGHQLVPDLGARLVGQLGTAPGTDHSDSGRSLAPPATGE